MSVIIEEIRQLFTAHFEMAASSIDKLPQSGSDRIYFRVQTGSQSFIATYNTNTAENKTFINFSRHFKSIGAPVPDVYAVNEKGNIYIQEDFGDCSLLNKLEAEGYTENLFELYKKSLYALAHLQINADAGLNYDDCITSKEFSKQAILSDLLYFKYYFLDTLKFAYDKEKLISDFEALSTYLAHVDHKYFMFRDFQSRNIMVKEDEVFFIDYQGGMKGALQYDVASLLWQAKADLSDDWKNKLLHYYIDCVNAILKKPFDRIRFESQYNGYVLIRLLQVLGAYGFRGLFERKSHFLTSIPFALQNLKWFLNNKQFGINLSEFDRLLQMIVEDEVVHRFEPTKANFKTPLVVKINSFSYIKTGYPVDETTNGGGFVFDCRGILNPGRIEEYKAQSGQDKDVKDYLEQETKMPDFLNNVYNIVDISVQEYIKRGFENLAINFGCTGGQHRSVYAAEALARHLKNKFGVRVELSHNNKDNWVRKMPQTREGA
ncbi:MAG: RNase adapter RapZ [Ferruginibacter sp.]